MSLRVTVTFEPNGDRSRATVIGDVRVANVSDLAPVSAYDVLTLDGEFISQVMHRRDAGFWPLVARVATACGLAS